MIFDKRYLLLFLFSACISIFAQAQNNGSIQVIIENIPQNQGQIIIKFYDNEKSFPKTPFKTIFAAIENHQATYQLEGITNGTYAIAVIYDQNSNRRLDFNWLHIPSEKVAASNNAKGFMGPPKWKSARFNVGENVVIQQISL